MVRNVVICFRMSINATLAPQAEEYAPYYGRYISLVPAADILGLLEQQVDETHKLLSVISEPQAEFRYAPGKWSIKQVLGHMVDTERIMSYRALRIARGDQTPIPGFEQDDYVLNGPFERCTFSILLEDFSTLRKATLTLFRNLDSENWNRRGVAAGNEVTVRALAYIIAGHEVHHCNVLRAKYLPGLKSR